LHLIADSADINEQLIRAFFDELAAQGANHAERLFLSHRDVSTQGGLVHQFSAGLKVCPSETMFRRKNGTRWNKSPAFSASEIRKCGAVVWVNLRKFGEGGISAHATGGMFDSAQTVSAYGVLHDAAVPVSPFL